VTLGVFIRCCGSCGTRYLTAVITGMPVMLDALGT